MAFWKSTGTYVNEVPLPRANILSGMWIFRVKQPPGSPPFFKARCVARGFSQRQGVDFFHTFSPTLKMTTLRVLLHVAAQRDYELHLHDFCTAFLQGSLHEEIWLRCPPGFTGSFPAVAESTTTLLCPAAPSGFLTGYYTPSFSRNLVSQSRLPRFLTSLRRLALPASRVGSTLPPTTAPLHTLHLDVWGPSPVLGPLRYAAHQLNLWSSDARPRVMPIFLWTGFLGVAGDYCVWGCLAHVHSPSANKLCVRTNACVFLGFPLDASGWVFYDRVTHQFFASQDVTFIESSSPPHRLVPIMSKGAGGAVAEGEGTGDAGSRCASSGGVGGVRVETTPEEDTAVLTQWPRPASHPGFLSVPQFPPSSPPRPAAAEPRGVPARGTGIPGGVVGGGSGSGVAGAENTSTPMPTPRTIRFLTRVQRLDRLEREE
ncbi:unnamed protein product [Closterium sp. NIES-54]